jgi:hypothetical protein
MTDSCFLSLISWLR